MNTSTINYYKLKKQKKLTMFYEVFKTNAVMKQIEGSLSPMGCCYGVLFYRQIELYQPWERRIIITNVLCHLYGIKEKSKILTDIAHLFFNSHRLVPLVPSVFHP